MRNILFLTLFLINGYFAYPFPALNVAQSVMLDRRSSIQHSITSRETIEVVWSCLATTISCTWIAIHPNVQFVGHLSRTKRMLRKLYLMVLTLLVPEMMVTWAYRQYMASRKICENVNKVISKSNQWTRTHAHFLQMGGLRLRCSKEEKDKYNDKLLFHYEMEDGAWEGVLTYNALMYFVDIGRLDCPSISEEEIKDKSKGDELFKALAILQLLWFVVQMVVRASIHLDVTNIELTTSALVAATLFMYWCWWEKPLDVQCPVILHLSISTDEPAAEEAPTVSESSNHDECSNVEAEGPGPSGDPQLFVTQDSSQMVVGDPMRPESLGTGGLAIQDRQHKGNRRRTGILTRLVKKLVSMERAIARMTPAPICDALFFFLMLPGLFVAHIITWPIDSLCCVIENGTYRPRPFRRNRTPTGALPVVVRGNKETVLTVLYISHLGGFPNHIANNAQILLTFGVIFGGVHCAAWTYPFPSRFEKTTWQIAACTITIPFGICLALATIHLILLKALPRHRQLAAEQRRERRTELARSQTKWRPNRILGTINCIGTTIYTTARVSIIILAIASLRKLPPTALQTVGWLNLIPHV